MPTKRAFLLAFCLFLIFINSICLTQQSLAEDKNPSPIRIGAISVLSGEGASWGVNHIRGTRLAAEEVNAKGGIAGKQIEIISEDSPGGLARNAVAAYSKLVHGNGVKFILGPVAMDELLAIAPLAKRDGVFLGGATYMPNAPSNYFSTWIDADIESDLVAAYVRNMYKRVAVLSSQQSWESQIAHRFKETFVKLGGEVVAFEEPSFEATEVRVEVLKAKQKSPEAIFISSYLLLPKYIKELKTLDLKPPLFGIELDQSVIDGAGEWAEGLVFISPSAPSDSFVTRFKERWQVNPDIPAANAYDAAKLLFSAIAANGEEVPKVIAFFAAFKGYDGATGHISRQDGKTVISTSYYVVRGGRIDRVQ